MFTLTDQSYGGPDATQPKTFSCFGFSLADIIYVNDFDFDEPIAVHIRHSKHFPVAG